MNVVDSSLSVVLPAFNEEANIERAVLSAAEAVAPLVSDYELVVVDDGSRDETSRILAKLAEELDGHLTLVSHPSNLGYGKALRSGFDASSRRLVFYTDADNQFDLRELEAFLPLMADHDAVLGYRVGRQDGWFRLLVSNGYNALASFAFGMSVRDLNCSFKLFRRDALTSLRLEEDHFFIDTEIVIQLHRAGYRYLQRGVKHYPRTAGRSSVRPTDVPRTFLALMKLWVRLRFQSSGRARLARD
ncbi:MAG TPA: glycosyltransferase family 2 protein [Vicinamibacteria bacterium]|nr:glycosyltransferase family 2 protein [Vicinamibacteria bacterium]